MIFVTIGSTKADRIIREIDEVAPFFGQSTTMQIGSGRYKPKNCRYFRFAPSLMPYYQAATIVIGHGGVGTIFELLRIHIPFIGVNNPELRDLHQMELLSYLSRKRYILLCENPLDLPSLVRSAQSFSFREYIAPPFTILNNIDNFLVTKKSKIFSVRN